MLALAHVQGFVCAVTSCLDPSLLTSPILPHWRLIPQVLAYAFLLQTARPGFYVSPSHLRVYLTYSSTSHQVRSPYGVLQVPRASPSLVLFSLCGNSFFKLFPLARLVGLGGPVHLITTIPQGLQQGWYTKGTQNIHIK